MKSDDFRSLIKKTESGDRRALSQLLTFVDESGPSVLKEKKLLNSPHKSFRIGITGPPGAGKSTLINLMIEELVTAGFQVGVLAVDPSSPFSFGAVLGDRVRYESLERHPEVFVRSIGSRGSLGGLCAQAYLMLRVFDLAKFDFVIVETVGVGQTELEIMHVADSTAVVLVPESGDGVQAMKAGLLEIADIFVVNKSDRPGADSLAKELEWMSEGQCEVLKTSAAKGEGVTELVEYFIEEKSKQEYIKSRHSKDRIRAEAQALFRFQSEREIQKKASRIETLSQLSRIK